MRIYQTIVLMLELKKYINSDVYISGEYTAEEVDYLTMKYQHDGLVEKTTLRLCPSI